jgi:hypothetical protein
MDTFGIGAALSAMVDIYIISARQSGKTTALVESVKEGDRIYFLTRKEADRVRHLCAERGVTVECIVRGIDDQALRGTAQGRSIFDHRWVEEFYKASIIRAQREIDAMEQMDSGYGAPHRETRRKALELSKWRF